jgi:hypothetical protein
MIHKIRPPLAIAILISSTLLPSLVYAQNTKSEDSRFSPVKRAVVAEPGFLERIGEQYSKLRQTIQQPVQNLTTDFTQGVTKLSQEIQSQVNQTTGNLGIPDLLRKGWEIEQTITAAKTSVFQINSHLQGRNSKQLLHQEFTTQQAGQFLSLEGQQKIRQEREEAKSAVDISTISASAAQNDHITQEIMKRIATQNTQTTKVLQLVQTSLQEQNKITTIANVNLADISQNLSTEQKRTQLEEQGRINAVYTSALFSAGFWGGK